MSYIILKGFSHQEVKTILCTKLQSSKSHEEHTHRTNGETDKPTVVIRNYNFHLIIINRTSRQKKNHKAREQVSATHSLCQTNPSPCGSKQPHPSMYHPATAADLSSCDREYMALN